MFVAAMINFDAVSVYEHLTEGVKGASNVFKMVSKRKTLFAVLFRPGNLKKTVLDLYNYETNHAKFLKI